MGLESLQCSRLNEVHGGGLFFRVGVSFQGRAGRQGANVSFPGPYRIGIVLGMFQVNDTSIVQGDLRAVVGRVCLLQSAVRTSVPTSNSAFG